MDIIWYYTVALLFFKNLCQVFILIVSDDMFRIPKDMMHRVPTSILHSLEGMPDVDWAKLLNLQSSDGSFLYSPSSTAYALMQTGDKKCFEYIDRIVKKFDGGGKWSMIQSIYR